MAGLLDATLLSQAPARPDRMQAADWALRTSFPATAGKLGALPQLVSVYLAAHTDLETGSGLSELDQMARVFGAETAELRNTLDQLAVMGLLRSWQMCPDSGDVHWTLAQGPAAQKVCVGEI